MKRFDVFKKVIDAIKDPRRNLQERVYLALTLISELAVFVALIGDVLTGEHPAECFVLVLTLVVLPTLMLICLDRGWMGFAIKSTVISLNFGILPVLFFFGGGVDGGGLFWIIFFFTYSGLVLTGRWRNVMMISTMLMTLLCYVVGYYHPEFVHAHSTEMHYLDTLLSIILVGIICFVMTRLQNAFFQAENARARAAVEKAEELTRSQNRFFSSMSHEIRTPINSILGLNELILRDQQASDDIVREAAGIQGSGKMLLALINDILDFSKMEAGSMDIVPVDYRIGDLLSEIVNMIWLRASEKGLQFRVTVDPKVPSVLYGDEVRIKQVLVNILNNAVKYTAEGSVELHLESEIKDEKTVELSISVSDTGMGIKKEALPDLFDAFKRVDEAKNRHIEGTGLGLSIVRQLVDLMGGTVSVNSVYGEGSTFSVILCQGISDATAVGELNIHGQSEVRRSSYECSFHAPEARILIVDDNEMNLEVESRLLADTQMTIDQAASGKQALKLAQETRYDAVLMDHLMPEMDGIECLEALRNQVGGMNRTTPVIVLTANAGSENKDLYNRAGFDGYLVKPVSGEALENTLIKYISSDKLIVNSHKIMTLREGISTASGYSGKAPVIITSTSMCDLPDSLLRKLNISILPFRIRTQEGIFKDGLQIKADEMVRYLSTGKNATSLPPDETAYTEFFASQLRHAHHLIHIALTTSMSEDYHMACEAAKSFDNVTVINSECLSSATGILVLIAYKLVQMNLSVEEIVAELETVKKRLKCSFVIDTTEYMARKGLIGSGVDRFARSLNLHPCLRIQNDRSGIGGIWAGDRRRAYRKYIARAFPVDIIPDPDVVFITYVDVPVDTLLWIREEISRIAYFEHVVFKQASAAISSNCGPGAFGILYFVKSNKSYNIASYIGSDVVLTDADMQDKQKGADPQSGEEEQGTETEGLAADETEAESSGYQETGGGQDGVLKKASQDHWYDRIAGIDGAAAIKNSGSEAAFLDVLQIFYDSIDSKAAQLEGYFDTEDWENYTIKVHALKSSARLIGALETARKAEDLEMAGKRGDTGFILENHAALMAEYKDYKEKLADVCKQQDPAEEEKPVADAFLMESIYEGFAEAAEAMDLDALEEIGKEIEGYAIPQEETKKFEKLLALVDALDYDGILSLLGK